MRLQAALNGPRTRDEHPAVPVLAQELAADAAACAGAGCFGVHVHPRDEDGRETLDCSAAVRDGLRRGRAVRIGFEDVLTLEDQSVAAGDEALVRALVALAGGR